MAVRQAGGKRGVGRPDVRKKMYMDEEGSQEPDEGGSNTKVVTTGKVEGSRVSIDDAKSGHE